MSTTAYFVNRPLGVAQLGDVYDRSGIRRPTSDAAHAAQPVRNGFVIKRPVP
ncbi:MAG: hypothetical protein KJ011_00865 [Burkholderiaceae bacterium]|nr:hypothetical protein [Burkholderiaceae bacterium]